MSSGICVDGDGQFIEMDLESFKDLHKINYIAALACQPGKDVFYVFVDEEGMHARRPCNSIASGIMFEHGMGWHGDIVGPALFTNSNEKEPLTFFKFLDAFRSHIPVETDTETESEDD